MADHVQLVNTEELFRGAMRAASIGMCLVAPDGSFLEVNPAGQWQFVESRAGLPITQAHADALRRMASAQRRRRGKTARSTQDHATP